MILSPISPAPLLYQLTLNLETAFPGGFIAVEKFYSDEICSNSATHFSCTLLAARLY